MRKEILLISLGVLFLFVVMGGFSAAGAVLTSPANGTNYSGSVLINVTFNNGSDINIHLNGTMTLNITALNATFYLKSINNTLVVAGFSSACANWTNGTQFSCWGTITLNRTYNGLFNVSAKIQNPVENGNWTSGNMSYIVFDTSPPNVTAIVTPVDGINYSGVLVNFSVSIQDGLRGNYMPAEGDYNKSACGLNNNSAYINISKSSVQQYFLKGWFVNTSAAPTTKYFNVTLNLSANLTSA